MCGKVEVSNAQANRGVKKASLLYQFPGAELRAGHRRSSLLPFVLKRVLMQCSVQEQVVANRAGRDDIGCTCLSAMV